MKKRAILMVSDDFLPNVGGIAAHVLEISRALANLGNRVVVLTRIYDPEEKYPELEIHDNIEIIRVRTSNYKKLRALEFIVKGKATLKKLIGLEQFDVIHSHKLITDSMITKVPFSGLKIFTNHSSTFLNWYANKEIRKIHFLLQHYQGNISPSNELHTKIQTIFPKTPSINISNGVDANKFKPNELLRAETRIALGYSDADQVVMIARRLEAKNGVRYFVEAIPEMVATNPQIQCLIVGDGSERTYIEKFIKEHKLQHHVTMRTNIQNHEMPSYFNAADLVVLPSLMEATSIAGLEAMACAKPLLGTRVGGIPEIIEAGRTGELIDAKSSKAIAVGVELMLANRQRLFDYGIAARESVLNHFSWEQIARKTVRFYEACQSQIGASNEASKAR
ncbi:glycosyltransferase family 4 protein [Listeria booriae]|uniref:Glycosyltransferase family 4 protein n=1 Tax=Listeria booriae TaxID=1552123 RepID=A0A841Y2G4_9LIST|nr:glycosyltransferase family 4 protein [Listeria booriae]MBC1371533.1 glycosyltransferase family 4 protein [Listeria booriae]